MKKAKPINIADCFYVTPKGQMCTLTYREMKESVTMRGITHPKRRHVPKALSREFAFTGSGNKPFCSLCKVRCASLEAHYRDKHPELYAARRDWQTRQK